MNVRPKTIQPGEDRCPGPSTRDIILSDGWNVPEALIAQSYEYLGDRDVDFARYTSPAFFNAEVQKLWPKVWQWACREENIPDVGDYYVYDVGPYSILVVRTTKDEVKAYHNSCLHRGTQLRESGTQGSARELKCPFHGWTWSLDGSLQHVPCRWDFPHVTDEAFHLPEVKVERWGGFIFINMDPEARPLADFMGVLPDHFKDGWDLAQRYTTLHLQKELPTNWKAAMEAFLEAYHVVETHAQGLATAGDANAQYDTFGEHVTRFVHTIGFPSPHYKTPQTQTEILQKLRAAPPGVTVPDGRTARSVASEHLRETLGAAWGVDLSRYSDSEMLDSIEYQLFPNMCLFPGVTLPMIYRFRPIGTDPGRTIFDLVFLRPLAPGQNRPDAPEPIKLGVDDSYASAPGMDPGLGGVYDQDTNNLAMQYRGFQASKKGAQTLGNYQEVRIRKFQQTVDRYLTA
jgi:phenylpropionate dioxygenase-like ring-hydroxylating dioxygenase large terminal subunit